MHDLLDSYLEELQEELLRRGISARGARLLAEECGFHLEEAHDELLARGIAPEQAARRVLSRFGAASELARGWAVANRSAPPRWCWIAVCSIALPLGLVASLPVGRWVEAALGMLLILPAVGLVMGGVLGLSQGWALRQRLDWLARWTLATALGLGLGLTAGTVLVESLGLERGRPAEEALGLLIIGLVMGSALALVQWHVARRSLRGAFRWVVAHGMGTAAGLGLGSLVAHLLGAGSGPTEALLILTGGAAVAAWAGASELDDLLARRGKHV